MAGFGSEGERRVEALRLVREEGVPAAEAARRVDRSRQWLMKWKRRAERGEGLLDQSRMSATSFVALDERWAGLVAAYRQELENDPVASIGGLSILAAMERAGLTGLPSVRSIERILTRGGMTRPAIKKASRSTTPTLPLPRVPAVPGIWQQTDWVQDRYLQGGIRFHSLQITDMGSAAGLARQYPRRSVDNVVGYLVEHAWPVVSIPQALSCDNAFSKTSHPNNPWTLFVRSCLFFGVEPVISPPYELGFTNGAENLNNLWQDRTIARRHYSTLGGLAGDTDRFNHWVNHQRPILDPTVTGTRYPAVLIDRYHHQLRWPPEIFITDHQDRNGHLHIPLTTGRITFLRRVTNRAITIAHTTWPIDLPDHSLVVASITTADATLTLRHHAQTIDTHPYPIHHPVTDPYHPPQTHSIYHHA